MPNWKKVIVSGSNASLNTLTVVNGITGTLTGNASTATTATNATNVSFNLTNNNANYPIAFSLDNNAGNKPIYLDTGLGCYVNPSTNTIGATTFVGALTGNASTATSATSATTATTATSADTVKTGLVTTNATHYLTYVPDNNLSATAESLGTVAALTYNPNSGHFTAPTISGSINVYSGNDITAATNLRSIFSSGDEGGEIFLSKSVTNTTLNTGVTIDVNQNKLRIFETGGTNRGYYLDISAGGTGVGTNLASGGGTVTSVATAGTVSGITLTGGPITGAGTITLGGSISGALSGIPSITNPGGAITIGSGMSLTGLTSVTVNPGSSSNPVGLSGSIYLPNIGTATKSNVIYYDTTTKQLTYGATPAGTVTSVATSGTVSGITLTGGTITSSGTITLGGSISGLTNSNLSGTAGITNANLANSTVTVGSTSISLGSSATTLAGLSSVTSTSFVGALTGNASTATTATTANATAAALTAGTYLTSGGTFNGSTARTFAVDATSANTASKVVARDASGNFSAGTITATLSGNATTATSATSATTATNANNINISATTSTDTTTSVVLVGSQATGNQSPFIDSGLTYNANTNTLSATTFSGALSGNATTATSAATAGTATNADLIYTSDGTTAGSQWALALADTIGNYAHYSGDGGLLYQNATDPKIQFKDLINGNRFNIGYLTSTGDAFIEAETNQRLFYYSDRHIWGDAAYNYLGTIDANGFDAAGDITCGGTKFFDIPHQTKQGWGLKHAAIEGPESGVYFRGKLKGSDEIELPEYWKWLVHKDTITVSLTPVGQYQTLYVKDIKDNKVYIGSDNDYVNCHYIVYGERADVEKWDAEYENYSRGEK